MSKVEKQNNVLPKNDSVGLRTFENNSVPFTSSSSKVLLTGAVIVNKYCCIFQFVGEGKIEQF